jgi:alkanesulfonate monooxygenase SsuD/methylene tetrahydromethanopterin reductase-like flavin-dependent oxidoreductase (luciferase family)
VPIWVSGTFNARVIRRLTAYGSAWIPWGPAAADLANVIPQVKQAMKDGGRSDADQLQVVGYLPMADGALDVAATEPLVAAGVTDFRCSFKFTDDHAADLAVVKGVVGDFTKAFR